MQANAWLRNATLVLALLAVLSQAAQAASTRRHAQLASNLVTIERNLMGPYSGRAFVVANTAAEWNADMAALDSAGALGVTPGPPPPAGVDWSQEVVILLAAGFTGYDVTLVLQPAGNGASALDAAWTVLGTEASWAEPYHLVRTAKRGWLKSQVDIGPASYGVLPITGPDDVPAPSDAVSWGELKAVYK